MSMTKIVKLKGNYVNEGVLPFNYFIDKCIRRLEM